MAEYKMVTPEMLATGGQILSVHITQIEPNDIRSYVAALEDNNPLWADPELARQSKYAGQIAPQGVLVERQRELEMQIDGSALPRYDMPFENPFPYSVDGGGEWWFYKPVRVGDTITAIRKIADFQEKEGRLGTMCFCITEVEHLNQRNELVAKGRMTGIWYA